MSGQVKFPNAERLASQLAGILKDRPVEIDATGLEETDAAILQVFVAARRDALLKGQDLKLMLPEDGQVVELMQRLGLTAHLMTSQPAA